MTYIRHRARMVQQSVFEDLRNTLIACRWMVGVTSREVLNPATDEWEIVTTAESDVFPIAKTSLTLLNAFPEEAGDITEVNTFAMDVVRPDAPIPLEAGSNAIQQPYAISSAFFAASDAVGTAVYQDLFDRYTGRLLGDEGINLYDYNTDPDQVVARLDIDMFRFTRDTQGVAPGSFLYFGELSITDTVD